MSFPVSPVYGQYHEEGGVAHIYTRTDWKVLGAAGLQDEATRGARPLVWFEQQIFHGLADIPAPAPGAVAEFVSLNPGSSLTDAKFEWNGDYWRLVIDLDLVSRGDVEAATRSTRRTGWSEMYPTEVTLEGDIVNSGVGTIPPEALPIQVDASNLAYAQHVHAEGHTFHLYYLRSTRTWEMELQIAGGQLFLYNSAPGQTSFPKDVVLSAAGQSDVTIRTGDAAPHAGDMGLVDDAVYFWTTLGLWQETKKEEEGLSQEDADARYLSFASPQDLSTDPLFKRVLGESWPEALSGGSYPYGAVGDGQSHPLSERYATLAEAQAVWPHVTSLDQEIDWAAMQAVLNTFNVTPGEEWGGILRLAQGRHYRLGDDTLVLPGPGIAILGDNRYGTLVTSAVTDKAAVALAPAQGQTIQQAKHSGLPKCIWFHGWRLESDFPSAAATNTSIGFSSLPDTGNQGFWYFIYFLGEQWDCHGFNDSVVLANCPIAALTHVSVTGKRSSVTVYKSDSLVLTNADVNGTWIPRQGIGQYDYDGNTNIRVLSADAATFDGDEVVAASGAGFFLKVLGGELGHSKNVLEAEGAIISIDGSNIEDLHGSEVFLIEGATDLAVEHVRFDVSSTSLECITRMLCPSSAGSHPSVRLRNCTLNSWDQMDLTAWPTVVTKPVIRVEGTEVQAVNIDVDQPYLVEFYYDGLNLNERIMRAGIIKSFRRLRIISPIDESHINEGQRGFHGWLPSSLTAGEDLLSIVQQGGQDGRWFRTSHLNNRLIQVLKQETADLATTGAAVDDLTFAPCYKNLFRANGDILRIKACGFFAANANAKTLQIQPKLVTTTTAYNAAGGVEYTDVVGADYGAPWAAFGGLWNGLSWHYEVEIQARSSTTVHVSSRLDVDGEPPRVFNSTAAFNDNALRYICLQGSGPAASDIICSSFTALYHKGISNI